MEQVDPALRAYQIYCEIVALFQGSKTYSGQGFQWFTMAQLEKRNDKYSFVKIAKDFPDEALLKEYILAVFTDHGVRWIRDLANDRKVFESAYRRRRKVLSNLKYYVLEDLKALLHTASLPEHIEQPTKMFSMLLRREINPESFVVLDRCCGIVELLSQKHKGTKLFEDFRTLVQTLYPIVPIQSGDWLLGMQQDIETLLDNYKA